MISASVKGNAAQAHDDRQKRGAAPGLDLINQVDQSALCLNLPLYDRDAICRAQHLITFQQIIGAGGGHETD